MSVTTSVFAGAKEDKKKENIDWEAEWGSSSDDGDDDKRGNNINEYENIPSEEEKRVEALMSKTERYKNILKSNRSTPPPKSGFLWENVSNQRDAMMCMLSSPDYPIESHAYLYAPEDDDTTTTTSGDSIFVGWFKSIAECCLPFCSPHVYSSNKNKRP